MPGRAAHRLQIALFEAFAVRAGELDEIVLRPIERGGRPFGLREQALEIGAGAVLERHVAPVLDRLGTLDAQPGIQHQDGLAFRGQLVGDQRADHARANDHDIGDRVAIGKNGAFHDQRTFGLFMGMRLMPGGKSLHHMGPLLQ
ncbi:hypothetical protein SAMN05518861_14224 [Mesorhizobium sp. YR577]|nr:hypothetical protein SAMN05518861_14224 [Mesorhizobium sp. YR577]